MGQCIVLGLGRSVGFSIQTVKYRLGEVTLTIAIALPFDSGIVLCADTSFTGGPRIFQKRYDSNPRYSRSIFAISDPVNTGMVVVRQCERALDLLQPGEYTIDRMRATIENALREASHGPFDSKLESNSPASLLIALYSSVDERYLLFYTSGIALRERVGYDCQGSAAYVGHFLLRDNYAAAESMGLLDLTTVSSIATETMQKVREYNCDVSDTTEIVIMFANGLASVVRRIRQDSLQRPKSGLLGDLSIA